MQNFSILCVLTCLMRQKSYFDSIQKLHFWKVPKNEAEIGPFYVESLFRANLEKDAGSIPVAITWKSHSISI